jgi:hypothetical protein
MGILDDAIREHLDLKRRHGARETELREIEDEAFGAGDQSDAFVAGEPYSEVGSAAPPDAGNEEPTRLVDAEALRPAEPASEPEAPRRPEPSFEPAAETSEQAIGSEPPSEIPGQVELPGQDEIPGQERLDEAEPEPEPPAEPVPEPAPEPPAASESLEELIAEEEPFPEDSDAPPPAAAAPETEVESEPESRPLEPEPDAQAPPEPAVPDPPPPPPAAGVEPPGRARGRIDVPTQEHPPPGETGDLPPLPGDEPELGRPDTTYQPPPPPEEMPSDEVPLPEGDTSSSGDEPQLYDFETDEEAAPSSSGSAVDDDFEALGPAEEEAPYLDEEVPYPEEPSSGVDSIEEEPRTEVRPAIEDEDTGERGSPDTEERSFEVDEEEGEEGLWFEKGPPKDFDFDDD